MIDNYVYNPKSIKYYIKKYLDARKMELENKIVIDIPSGNGVTTEILLENGAKPEAFDLFPEYFMLKNILCKRADIVDKIPVADGHADMLICQEGIEHFSDQLKAFREFNRVLRKNGELIITTPSYSNLAARFSYLLFESENYSQMPPNEVDDIWMADKSISNEIYYGHIFLVGLQKLRVLGKLSGFSIKTIKYVRLSKGSLFLFPFIYPILYLSSYFRFYKKLKKHSEVSRSYRTEVYRELLKINISPKNLLNKHTFIVFEKENELTDVNTNIEAMMRPFDKIM
jgi:SAM-dependent methyltransferase